MADQSNEEPGFFVPEDVVGPPIDLSWQLTKERAPVEARDALLALNEKVDGLHQDIVALTSASGRTERMTRALVALSVLIVILMGVLAAR